MRNLKNKFINFVKSHPVVLSAIAVTAITPALVWAYGPNRETFTMEKPASYVTFNSITNNPVIGGDERDFVGIREVGTNTAWTNNMKVQNGKEYYIRVYVHNNAASNLNLVAENVVAKLNVPTTTGKSVTVQGQVSASNAKPTAVWDEATFSSDNNFNLAYISGSALYENNGMGKTALADSIVTNAGVRLGYDKLDGKIPGCMQYAGYVTVKVKAQVAQPAENSSIDLAKTVRNKTNGEKTWSKAVNAKSGDTVQYQIHAKNTGSEAIQNLVIRDILPKGINYVAGSAKLYNTSNPNGLKISDNIIANSGANVGTYQVKGDAYVRFDAVVAANDQLPVCGENTLTNIAQASNQKITKNDTANVKVNKTCETPKKPAFKCENLSVNKLDRTKFEFNTNYTSTNTTFIGVKYIVKDASGKIVVEKTVNNGSKFTLDISIVGKYTVTSVVITKDGENTNSSCVKNFEVKSEDKPSVIIKKTVNGQKSLKIEANKDFNYELTVSNNGNTDLKNVTVTDKAPANITFVNSDNGKIENNVLTYTIDTLKIGESKTVVIKSQATATGISTTNTACVDTPTVPGNNDGCDSAKVEVPKTPTPNTPNNPTPNTPNNPTTPSVQVPSELPQTGADMLSAIFGIGSITVAAGYYFASRKQL